MVCENDEAAESAKAVVSGLDGVQLPETHANELHFVFAGARNAIPEILTAIVSTGIRVVEFKEDQTDLEQVFLSVTHH